MNMEKPEISKEPQEGDVKIIEGKKYKYVFSGYTIREYYSHSTPEKGPGPGWDFKQRVLDKYGVMEASELPDDPHCSWEYVEEDE